MSKPVSTVLKLSSLKTESARRYRSFNGPIACAVSSCRQSRTSCGLVSDGTKIATRSRRTKVPQSTAGVLRLARYSAQLDTRGTTKQAAFGTTRCITARGWNSMVIAAVLPGSPMRTSIPASFRNRPISRARSGRAVGGTSPTSDTVTGPSNRLRTGTVRPLSMRNVRSRISAAIAVFDRCGAAPTPLAKLCIAGRAVPCNASSGRFIVTSACGAGVQAVRAIREINENTRMSGSSDMGMGAGSGSARAHGTGWFKGTCGKGCPRIPAAPHGPLAILMAGPVTQRRTGRATD